MPGPGNYNPNIDACRSSTQSLRFGNDIRKPLYNEIKDNPGPGQYENQSKIFKAKDQVATM
ncbi:hypothetical protein IMG5_144640 [Ichthyophthirius multifiliis]|uniref:Uncharacterized protein n=1 Tax=Ichthyophthirius multifiliis TaxID=5932 RepID=G0QXQ3_ICHMU|nr:hypothetical protein IMG5_144640 [Ichthyophthirius multifiliis]EGR29990.1 hypothetical protein IMG5_144640 [Ichthyophthirius multifiliis]|eukprot:XP_004031226.1 hypothetical protein IMG5_144640 [Ichthyophthirius multifiliis]